jgi:competence protein ComEC
MLKSTPANFTFYPLFWLAVCFAGGIAAANFLALDWKIYFSACFIFSILTAVFIKQKFVLLLLCLAFFTVGGLYLQIERQTVAENRVKRIYDENRINSGDPIEIEGVLQSKPELAVGGFFLVLKTERAVYKNLEIKMSGNVRLFAATPSEQIKSEYEALTLNYGTRIRVACNLRREDAFLNAGVVSRKEVLDQKDIDATASVKSPLLVERMGEARTFLPLAWIYERRQNLILDFRDNFSVSTAGILIASLLGNSHFLDKQTAEIFRAGGTFHVLVISGLHITFIGGLTLLLVQFFTNKRIWQFLFATSFLWAYSLAVGADVPVVRATIMFTILLFSQVIYRRGTLLNSLGFCALILLVWRPDDIFSSSFQLTFASVSAIVAIAFPLIEKLRSIGGWQPSSDTPFPPNVPIWLKRFCETLNWRQKTWERELSRQLWTANLFKSPYLKWLKAKNLQTVSRYIFEALLVSAIMQICLLPLMAIYFHRFPVLGVFLNLWVGLIIALESFAAMFVVLFAGISHKLALPIIQLTETLNWSLVSVPNFITENSWTNLRLPVYSGAMRAIYILYFVPVIFLTAFLNKWNPFALISESKFQILTLKFSKPQFLRVSASLLILFFAIIIFHPFSAPLPDGRLHIDFLDVGQGDAALIRFPTGETMLVDGGGRQNYSHVESEEQEEIFEPDTRTIGEAVVSEFLWERGYSGIDFILATHADADHILGLSDVAKNFTVKAAVFGRTPETDSELAGLFSVLQNRQIESVTISRGDVLTFERVKIEVLYPEKDSNPEAVSDNNRSLVLRIIFGERKFLLTGDIEKETERELMNEPGFLQTDLIKVAHHGSRTSSIQEFVKATNAKLAVVSVGRESQFGHPHEEVVERWKNAGAKILTTGENGTISISTDGRDLQMKTFNGRPIYR